MLAQDKYLTQKNTLLLCRTKFKFTFYEEDFQKQYNKGKKMIKKNIVEIKMF